MKKNILRRVLAGCLLGVLAITTACSSNPNNDKTPSPEVEPITLKVASDTLYVNKVENLTDDFMLGMDASAVISLEDSGVKYYDFEGNEQDVYKTLAESGVNTIRVRVWNDPYDKDGHGYGGGNCDIQKCLEIGKRATKYGMSLIVSFHYSDFWADPAKQFSPKAWNGLDSMDNYALNKKMNSPKALALYNYTVESLQLLKDNNVNVKMVSIGNETTRGFAGETKWTNMWALYQSGAKAVRKVLPDALVAVHFTNPEKANNYVSDVSGSMGLADRLAYYNVDYDVFASSYYPYWHGTLDNLGSVLSRVAEKYNKKVMVMETSYANTLEDSDFYGNTISNGASGNYPFTIQGQVSSVRDIVDTMVNHTNGNGIGVCYWEGTWITVGTTSYDENALKWEKYGSGWATSYAKYYDPDDAGKWYGGCSVDNQAFFKPDGKPYESLKMFGLLKTGNVVKTYVDGIENVEITKRTDETFTLPETVNVVMSDNSKTPIAVTWEAFDIEAAKAKGNGKYSIKGVAGGKEVYCQLTIMEYNFLTNYSFEDGKNGWTVASQTTLSASNKAEVTAENPQTGKYAFHFWGSSANSVNFSVEQTLTGLNAGIYKYTGSLLGGASSNPADQSAQNIYLYVKINGEIKYTKEMKFTNYNDGYSTYVLEGIEVAEGDTVVVGFNVQANESGSWGDIDDLQFNFVGAKQ